MIANLDLAGVPLASILNEVGVKSGANLVRVTGVRRVC